MPTQTGVGREMVDWQTAYSKHGPALLKIESVIAEQETKYALTLTPDAVEVLLLPFLVELERRNGQMEQEKIQHTVERTFTELKNDPDKRDSGTTRSVFSVIKAWWKGWCDIPPICGPTDE